MERKSRFYREWERTDHSFGVTTPEKIADGVNLIWRKGSLP